MIETTMVQETLGAGQVTSNIVSNLTTRMVLKGVQ